MIPDDPYDWPEQTPGTDEPPAPAAATSSGESRSTATRLVHLAEAEYRIVCAEDGTPYAVAADGPNVAVPLRGRDGLRQRLALQYRETYNAVPSGSALADAVTVLEGIAATRGREAVCLRTARAGGRVVLDMGDVSGRALTVTPGQGWQIEASSPVLFRRTALTGPIGPPAGMVGNPVAALDRLHELLNVDGSGFRLLVGWLLTSLVPDHPYPILALLGQQGTAKSTAARLLVSLIDPSPTPTHAPPAEFDRWVRMAGSSHVVAVDNVSRVPGWFSDALCRASTGEAVAARALYTDDDLAVWRFRRPVIMTSIDPGALAGDVADRLLPVELDPIADTDRLRDADVTARADAARPVVLGALLTLLADVLAAMPDVAVPAPPRMADFAAVLAALDLVTGWSTLDDYRAGADDVAAAVVESDPFAVAVVDLATTRGVWTGTAHDLLDTITPDRPPRGWPRTPRAAAGQLKRITPALSHSRVVVDGPHRETRTGRRLLTIRRTAQPATDTSPEHDTPPPAGYGKCARCGVRQALSSATGLCRLCERTDPTP